MYREQLCRYLLRIGILIPMATGLDAVAQPSRMAEIGPLTQPAEVAVGTPVATDGIPPVSTPLVLRQGAVPTGLGGFYDYQSNGGSPTQLYIPTTNWDAIYTTYLDGVDGTNLNTVASGRRAGYAFSGDGGKTWAFTKSIDDIRLGFPALQVDSKGSPYIGVHGIYGGGERSFIYSAPHAAAVTGFISVGEMPILSSSGRTNGVGWPSFVLTGDDREAVMVASYYNNPATTDAPAPMHVGVLDLTNGTTSNTWKTLGDSTLTTTSGGRTVVARSREGKIGVAYYRHSLDTLDAATGIYFSESTDNGRTWSTPSLILSTNTVSGVLDINGDPDTLRAGGNLDLTYNGNEPQIVFTGNLNNVLQYANVLYWSPPTGLKLIALSHQVPGLGAYAIPLEKRQANMGSIAYPTICVGEDGRHIVVAFSAVSQTLNDTRDSIDATVSEQGFHYYRLWAVGSADGGKSWGKPFIVQDFAGQASDSASIEFPSANQLGRMVEDGFELPVVFQARRYPGMYAFTGSGAGATEAGPITETYQYFQRFTVAPAMFQTTSGIDGRELPNPAAAELKIYPSNASMNAMVEYTLPGSGRTSLRVFNTLGVEVMHPVRDGIETAGSYRRQIDLEGLPAGAYHVVLTQNGSSVSRPLTIVR